MKALLNISSAKMLTELVMLRVLLPRVIDEINARAPLILVDSQEAADDDHKSYRTYDRGISGHGIC